MHAIEVTLYPMTLTQGKLLYYLNYLEITRQHIHPAVCKPALFWHIPSKFSFSLFLRFCPRFRHNMVNWQHIHPAMCKMALFWHIPSKLSFSLFMRFCPRFLHMVNWQHIHPAMCKTVLFLAYPIQIVIFAVFAILSPFSSQHG